jgi:hypothetical protein
MDINALRTNYTVKQMIEEMRTTSQPQNQFQLDVDIRKSRQKRYFKDLENQSMKLNGLIEMVHL